VNLVVSRCPVSPDVTTEPADSDDGQILHATIRRTGSVEKLPDSLSTNQIIPGKETQIMIDKGSTGLGLSIVGGSDTLLVSVEISLFCLFTMFR